MRVKVKYLGLIYSVTRIFEEEVSLDEGSTILDLLEYILGRYEGLSKLIYLCNGSLNPLYRITVNGRDVEHLDGLYTKLSDGDKIALIGPAGG